MKLCDFCCKLVKKVDLIKIDKYGRKLPICNKCKQDKLHIKLNNKLNEINNSYEWAGG